MAPMSENWYLMTLIMKNRHLFSIVVVVAQNNYSVIERLLSYSYIIQPFSLWFCLASVTWFLLRQTQGNRQVNLLFFQRASATLFLPHQLINEQTHWYRTTLFHIHCGADWMWQNATDCRDVGQSKECFQTCFRKFCTFITIFNRSMSPWVLEWWAKRIQLSFTRE